MSESLRIKIKILESGNLLKIICPLESEVEMSCDLERMNLICWKGKHVCDHLHEFPEDVVILEVL